MKDLQKLFAKTVQFFSRRSVVPNESFIRIRSLFRKLEKSDSVLATPHRQRNVGEGRFTRMSTFNIEEYRINSTTKCCYFSKLNLTLNLRSPL